ncbi:hypothetical protein C0J52_13081 [Blattella germanica]|nr:hypothetical protein C0J52_13081 [Blattella germanica]
MSEDTAQIDSDQDMFADCSPMEEDELSEVIVMGAKNDMGGSSTGEQTKTEDKKPWLGATLEEIRNGSRPSLPQVTPSQTHTVFFECPIGASGQPLKPHPQKVKDCWDSEHVRMPYSEHNLYPVQEGEDQSCLRRRWKLMQEAFQKSIMSSQQLEAAILSYNSKYSEYWDFSLMHMLFTEIFSEDETNNFFSSLLPKIVRLALQLPTLITAPVPLLVQHRNHTLSFSQLQIASLLANAFLCAFPRRNTTKKKSEYAQYPDINFNRLYQGNDGRWLLKSPQGVVTYSRRYVSQRNLPHWDKSYKLLTKLHISSEGNIEDDGEGMIQVDFANRLVGGGVLGGGCVQEEIRFVICPELIVSRLFTEALDLTEALLIVGCERFSMYTGYCDTFEWTGDYRDRTPHDSSRRRICSIVAIDALRVGSLSSQFTPNNVMRELNKAYAGFHCPESTSDERLAGVASGNWGCGAFRGDAKLKTLIQLMAATQAGRSLAYFTFGNTELRDEIFHMYTYLKDQQITVGHLWRLLCKYYDHSFRKGKLTIELYPYLYQTFKQKKSPTIFGFLTGHKSSRPSTEDKPKGEANVWLCCKNRGGLTEKEIEEILTSEESNQNTRRKENEMQSKGDSHRDTAKSTDADISIGDTFMNEVQAESLNDNSTEELETVEKEKSGGSVNKVANEKKGSLLDYLDQYERSSLNRPLVTPSPTSKRKISDYFTSVPRS